MKQLYLLRHGQSIANAERRVAGALDTPLSELGRTQVRLATDTIRRHFPIDLIVSSPMRRALETAQILADGLAMPAEQIVIRPELRERDLGSLEGVEYALAPQHNGNYEDVETAPGVEPILHLHQRAIKALAWLQQRPEQRILVVAHNGIGRMLKVASAGGEPLDLYKQPRLDNAIVYELG